MRRKYDIVKDATALVESQLGLLQALYLAKQTQAEGRSRLICRCGACRTQRAVTLDWLNAFLVTDQHTQAVSNDYPATTPVTNQASLPSD
jgi:hypothetical protein